MRLGSDTIQAGNERDVFPSRYIREKIIHVVFVLFGYACYFFRENDNLCPAACEIGN